MKAFYTVAVLGFNATEHLVLGSIFGLSARRTPKFVRHQDDKTPPDVYLVDADDVTAITTLMSVNPDRAVPSILIGVADHGTGWPRLSRPLQWARLFVAFDLAVRPRTPRPVPTTSMPAATVAPPAPITPPAPAAQVQVEEITPPPVAAPFQVNVPPMDEKATVVLPDGAAAMAAKLAEYERQLAPKAQPAPGSPPPPPAGLHAVPARTEPPAAAPRPAPPADCVMVVDDSLAVREFMRVKLAPFQFDVDYAASGEEAIGLTANKHYVCVFLDVVMPGIDGYQVCKMIKSRKAARPTAVVMLTSKGSPFDRIKGKMAGCDAYLTKPVDEEKLLEVIARYLPAQAAA